MGGEFSIEESLETALGRYRDHQAAGDDMAQAGEELFKDVQRTTQPRPCAPARYTLLEMISVNRDPHDVQEIKELVLGEPDSEDRRKVLRRIDERLEELRSMDESDLDVPRVDQDLDETAYVVPLDDCDWDGKRIT